MLIVHKDLAALFSRIVPLSIKVEVVFEQVQGGVEGDSASCTELYVLLSSLSGLALRQVIAVTSKVYWFGSKGFTVFGDFRPARGVLSLGRRYFHHCPAAHDVALGQLFEWQKAHILCTLNWFWPTPTL